MGKKRYKKDEINKKYCVKRNKLRKLVNPKVSYIFDKILVLFIIFGKYAVIVMIEYLKKREVWRH